MKVAVCGGGSSYTPELVKGFLDRRDTFPLQELWLMDVDEGNLATVGGLAQRMATARGQPGSKSARALRVVLSTDRRAAIKGASYVIAQLRVGQMLARRADEYLGKRHGLIGQETTGIGGMAKALRTVPVLLDIAADMAELAPGALLVNFTNPSGLVTEALQRHAPGVASVGVCNVPIATTMHFLESLRASFGKGYAQESAMLDTLGLNHLSWHRGFRVGGRDMWADVFGAYLAGLRSDPSPEWDPQTIEALQMIPNAYLHYYYHTAQKLVEQDAWPPSRAETVMEIERELRKCYADPALCEAPPGLMKRGGAYYSTAATQLLNAHFNDLGEMHVVSTRHAGRVSGWPSEWVLEMPCRIDRQGVHPLPAEPLPQVCAGLLAHVKAYELLAVEAAVQGSRRLAFQALLAHPLGPSADHVQEVLDDLLETNRAYLPRFFGSAAGKSA